MSEAAGGGVLEMLRTLTAGQAEAGDEVGVAWGQRPETPSNMADQFAPGVASFRLPWGRRTLRVQGAAARGLRNVARRWDPEVIHLHSSFAGAVGAVALGRRWPLVYSPHGFAYERSHDARARVAAYAMAERFIARRCDVLGAVSDAEAAAAVRLGVPRVVSIPNGIGDLDPGRIPLREEAPSELRVIGLGRVGPQHPPGEVAEILSAVAARAVVAWIGGGTEEAERPLRAAGIRVSGWLPHEHALGELAAATVYLHWSSWDGLPLAILEALARDVVVIASDIPPTREIVGAAQVARTPSEAIRLLERVLHDEALRESLLAHQRERRERWSAARMVSGWRGVYADAAARH